MVSCTVGSGTKTDWKRRARAGSFSMYLRYSFNVVAPTLWIPGQRLGLLAQAIS